MLYVGGLLVLSLLITAAIVIILLLFASAFAYWLVASTSTKSAKLRRLLAPLLKGANQDAATDASNDGGQEGEENAERLCYHVYPAQNIQKSEPLPETREWGGKNLTGAREHACTYRKEDDERQYANTSIEGLSPRRASRRYSVFSQFRHVLQIVNRLRRRVNHSGREPTYWPPCHYFV